MAEDPTAFTALQSSGLLRLHGELAAEDVQAFLESLTPDQRRALPRLHTDCYLVLEQAAGVQSEAETARGGGNGKAARSPKPSTLSTRS